jgi:hypothetical protein
MITDSARQTAIANTKRKVARLIRLLRESEEQQQPIAPQ